MTSDGADRIEALETALAHAEAAIDDLSDVVRSQTAELDELRRDFGKLTRTLQAMMEDQEESAPADQRPPHY